MGRGQGFRPADVPHLQADSSKFRAAVGWRPKKTIEDIIRDLADYYTGRWKA